MTYVHTYGQKNHLHSAFSSRIIQTLLLFCVSVADAEMCCSDPLQKGLLPSLQPWAFLESTSTFEQRSSSSQCAPQPVTELIEQSGTSRAYQSLALLWQFPPGWRAFVRSVSNPTFSSFLLRCYNFQSTVCTPNSSRYLLSRESERKGILIPYSSVLWYSMQHKILPT